MNPYTDLEFSLDGQSWESEPQKIIGDWGCDAGDASSTPEISLPCRMGPGDEVSRTYFVRNSTDTGQPGLFTVGVGDYTVTDSAEFTVSSSISEINGTSATTGTAALIGPNAQSTATPAQRDQALSSLVLAPGEEAMVVDTVTVPRDASEAAQLQSTSPKLWIDFVAEVNDSDNDGLPDDLENQVGTDPNDPSNSLPPGKVGDEYGPEPLLPGAAENELKVKIDETKLPPGLDYVDGEIIGTPTEPGTFEIPVTVTDANGNSHESIVTIVIAEADPDSDEDGIPDHVEEQIGTDPSDPLNKLPDGKVGDEYGPEPFLPGAGDAGLSLELDATSLPPGLRYENGEIVGVPTRPGTFEIPVTLSDGNGKSYDSIVTIVVVPADRDSDGDGLPDFLENEVGTDPLNPLNPLPEGTVGDDYGPEALLPGAADKGIDVAVNEGTLPPGLEYRDGAIVGTPEESGTFEVEITVTDQDGTSHNSVVTIIIKDKAPTIDTDGDGLPDDVEQDIGTDPSNPLNPMPIGKVDEEYGPHPLLPGVGDKNIDVTIDEDDLPPGLTFEDGKIGGTPTKPGKYEIDIVVTDENGEQHESTVTIIIEDKDPIPDTDGDGLPDDLEDQIGTDPADPANSLPPGKVGDDYGPHPLFPGLDGEGITVTIDEGALPPGLKYEDGNIVGTPTQPGKYEIAVTVIDENGDKHESIVTIVIQPEDEEPTGSSGTVLIPIVVGIIGAIGAIGSLPHILPWLPIGSSDGGSSDGSSGSSNGSGTSGSSENNGNATEGSKAPQRLGAGDQARDEQVDDALKSQAGRTGSPDPSWQDENSQVRADGLANTGVNVGQMLLWALTALAAGFTLILIARRRRDDEEQEASEA